MACGSGAFLVEADRYLADRLLEAWESERGMESGEWRENEQIFPALHSPHTTPHGTRSKGELGEFLIPADEGERLVAARRIVAQRCLYGVDKNRLAAEMAKLSLWLFTLAKDKPFTFLDHAIRSGDSLIGVSDEQLKTFSLDGDLIQNLEGIGRRFNDFRDALFKNQACGPTALYNRFHSPEEGDADIQLLRDLHVEMNVAVATAYGWSDLDYGHGFHETKQGVRFTISEPARREVLARLLKLNHERYAEEVERGLHEKKVGRGRVTNDENWASGTSEPKAKRGRKSKASPSEPTLFGDGDDEPEPAGNSQGEAAPAPEPAPAPSDRADQNVQ
jgi:hypothetical protein